MDTYEMIAEQEEREATHIGVVLAKAIGGGGGKGSDKETKRVSIGSVAGQFGIEMREE